MHLVFVGMLIYSHAYIYEKLKFGKKKKDEIAEGYQLLCTLQIKVLFSCFFNQTGIRFGYNRLTLYLIVPYNCCQPKGRFCRCRRVPVSTQRSGAVSSALFPSDNCRDCHVPG